MTASFNFGGKWYELLLADDIHRDETALEVCELSNPEGLFVSVVRDESGRPVFDDDGQELSDALRAKIIEIADRELPE